MVEDRRHAAIMFTDIVGYTALMGRDEDAALDMLSRNHILHEAIIEKHNGTLIKEIGDGTLASFPLASNAVRCAMDIQKEAKNQKIPLKIGIHEGEMVFAGGDVLGDGVNIASRLQESAQEGCINISASVYRDIKNKPEIKSEFFEEMLFKNVDDPVQVYKVFCDEIHQKNINPLISEHKVLENKSIIVLPFVNISPDPDQEYFSDGLTEEIITDLSFIQDLLVISRSSAMTFKGSVKKLKDIAKEVNVHYVLEGSVRRAGNNLRITAQLIDASTDAHLWAEKYSGTLDDVFDIQEKVSRSIADALKIKLIPNEKQKISERPIDDFQTYEIHIKAQNIMSGWTTERFERALQYLEKGLEISGENEILFADIGQIYINYLETGLDKDDNIFLKAEKYINKVFSINPDSSHGYYLRGHLKRWKGLIKESVIDYKKALSIDSNHFYTRFYLSWLYAFSGKMNTARPIINVLMTIDPLNPLSYIMSGIVEVMDGRFKKSIEYVQKGNQLAVNQFLEWWHAKCLAYNKNFEESFRLLDNIIGQTEESHWKTLSSFFSYSVKGQKSNALNVVTKEFNEIMKGDELYPIWMAECYALLDMKEESINWIEEGINNHFINYPFLVYHNSFLENIREEERFKKLMKRVKLEWENFEV